MTHISASSLQTLGRCVPSHPETLVLVYSEVGSLFRFPVLRGAEKWRAKIQRYLTATNWEGSPDCKFLNRKMSVFLGRLSGEAKKKHFFFSSHSLLWRNLVCTFWGPEGFRNLSRYYILDWEYPLILLYFFQQNSSCLHKLRIWPRFPTQPRRTQVQWDRLSSQDFELCRESKVPETLWEGLFSGKFHPIVSIRVT